MDFIFGELKLARDSSTNFRKIYQISDSNGREIQIETEDSLYLGSRDLKLQLIRFDRIEQDEDGVALVDDLDARTYLNTLSLIVKR